MAVTVPGTLVVYEDPAARHMIEDWRRAESARIAIWENARPPGRNDWYERVTMLSGEVLLLVPSSGGCVHGTAAWNAAQEALRPTGFIGKLLMFGKVPVLCPQWDYLLGLAKESAAEALARG